MARRHSRIRLNEFQSKELSRYCFDLSKLVFASLVLKLFEPGGPKLDTDSTLGVLYGLFFLSIFAILGHMFGGQVRV